MKKTAKWLVPFFLIVIILFSLVWYCFVYDRDFTRDMLLNQARHSSNNGNPKVASWFYNLAYEHSGQDERVAIELANQFKADGNYTKAEVTLANAIADGGTSELYMTLCKTYVEKDKLLDAVTMLDNIADPVIKAELDALRPAVPTCDPEPGYYSQYIPVTLSTDSGTLYYTTDGEYPTTDDEPYSEPFTLSVGETTIQAISVDENGLVSPRGIYSYTVGGVIEEVGFTDQVIEHTVRQLIGRNDEDPIFSNELWNITTFSVPAETKYFDDLTKFTYLETLEIDGQTLDSMRFLSSLTYLKELKLTNCRIPTDDINTIAALPSLQKLTMSDCGISTIAGLEKAQNLVFLDLKNNTIRNLDPLASLIGLQEIDLQHNALTGLNALSGLSELKKLDVSYNSLTSIAPIATCKKLEWLNMSNNELAELAAINNLPALTYVAANNNDLTSVDLLADCIPLKELHVANNNLASIGVLSGLGNLEVIDFSGNDVEELPHWPDNSKLRIVDGSHNKVTSLEALANQMELTHVYMDYNAITSVNVLENCYKLVMVNVYGNEIEDVHALTERSIIVNWDPT